MSEESKLKPCRYCGLDVTLDAIKVKHNSYDKYTAKLECPDCGESAAAMQMRSTREEAISDVIIDWNRRWTDPALTARIEELEAERDQLRNVAEKLVWLYSDEYSEKRDNGLRIDGFYSHEWLDMILNMAREALKEWENE